MSLSAHPAIAEARNVTVAFGPRNSHVVLDGISLAIQPDEIVAVLGPSGCGKSTLLRVLAGLIPATSGEVLCHGQPLRAMHAGIAIVFQGVALFPWLTVRQNVELALANSPLDAEARRERVEHCIGMVGLSGNEQTYPKELSGGMKQRVGIARALAADPEMLCMDEPFSALDVFTAESLRSELYELWNRWKQEGRDGTGPSHMQSILLITHLIEEAVFLADRIVVMGTNPGRVRQVIVNSVPHPRDYQSPAFLAMVRRIHEVIISEHLPDAPPSSKAGTELEPIPIVHLSEVFGLLEIVLDHGGQSNVFALHDLTSDELGHTLSVVMAAEMLGFLDTPKEVVVVTDRGRELLLAKMADRQSILRAQLLELPLFRYVDECLTRAPDGRLDKPTLLADLRDRLQLHEPEPLWHTMIAWARFAELFDFDATTAVLSRRNS